MAALPGIKILLFGWLCWFCHASNIPGRNETLFMLDDILFVRRSGFDAFSSEEVGLSDEHNQDLVTDAELSSYDDTTPISKLINFALEEINKATNELYKEDVAELIEIQTITGSDIYQYNIRVRLTPSKCMKNDSLCVVGYDPKDAKTDEFTPIIAALEPPMRPGKQILIEGRIPLKSKGFYITIQSGYKVPTQAQLRFSAKFLNGENSILLEHFDKAWNIEQHFEGILETKTNFSIMIVCLSTKFEIYVNSKILSSFNHILPYQNATHFSVFGEVDITTITGIGPNLPIDVYDPLPAWENDNGQVQDSVYVPFTSALNSPLAPGRSVIIKGRVPEFSKQFSIYIQTGADDNSEAVQLRVTPSFSTNDTMLSYYDKAWLGNEIYNQILTAGCLFRIVITCLREGFKITVDGKELATYAHRLPYQSASHLRIIGRVNISEVVGIDKLPPINSFDPPRATPLHVPLHDLPLAMGRKLKIWAYVPQDSDHFLFRIGNGPKNDLAHLELNFGIAVGKWFVELRTYNGTYGNIARYTDLDWFEVGETIQMDIECLQDHFKVSTYGNDLYNYSYQLPFGDANHLTINGTILVSNVTGESIIPTIAPVLAPPSRVCEMNVWSKPNTEEMWLNKLDCVDGDSFVDTDSKLSQPNTGNYVFPSIGSEQRYERHSPWRDLELR